MRHFETRETWIVSNKSERFKHLKYFNSKVWELSKTKWIGLSTILNDFCELYWIGESVTGIMDKLCNGLHEQVDLWSCLLSNYGPRMIIVETVETNLVNCKSLRKPTIDLYFMSKEGLPHTDLRKTNELQEKNISGRNQIPFYDFLQLQDNALSWWSTTTVRYYKKNESYLCRF